MVAATMNEPQVDNCPACGGVGSFEEKPSVWEPCKACNGTGKDQPDVALNIRNIPRDVRSDFKAFCAKRSISMQDALVALIRMALNRRIELED